MERFTRWFDFGVNYILIDRMDEDGDSRLIIFDLDIEWAIAFNLIKEKSIIKIELRRK